MKRRVAVIGGTGFYDWGPGEAIELETEHGPVSLTHHPMRSSDLFFLPRHGPDHALPPHRINYRAHIRALRALHADWVIALFNAGGLDPRLRPGEWAVPHDVLDFTNGRNVTFHDERAVHVDMNEPYCPHIRAALISSGPATTHDQGTYAATEGPRFETQAELRLLRLAGADLVGMTGVPEVTLAREAGLCYGAVCFVANASTKASSRSLSAQALQRAPTRHARLLHAWIERAITRLPAAKRCRCGQASRHAELGALQVRRRSR